jgi:NADPH:quinone reductase-like Zn-dependent oxidoreductase
VVASGTNPVEAKIRQGAAMPDLPLPAVLGGDVSGVVEALGAGVSDFAVGDEVFYTPELTEAGSYADYNVASASIVAPKPRALSHVEAAAVPLAGGTAWEAIVRRLRVRPGETVLVHAGAGGVGSFAVQFAVAAGADVLATASPGNHDLVRELGAVPIDYKSDDPAQVALDHTGVDAVLDLVGGENLVKSAAATRPFGRLATVLAPAGELTPLYQRNQVLHGIMLTRERRRLEELSPLFERGHPGSARRRAPSRRPPCQRPGLPAEHPPPAVRFRSPLYSSATATRRGRGDTSRGGSSPRTPSRWTGGSRPGSPPRVASRCDGRRA